MTRLLQQWRAGDVAALENLMVEVYDELKKMARARLRNEPGYHTLQATALIHECFMKLVTQDRASLSNRGQFFAIAARMMRRILLDHARAKKALKRKALVQRPTDVDVEALPGNQIGADPVMLDDALVQLAKHDPELCLLVELKHLGGFSMGEISEILNRPESSLYRMWKLAKAHLYRYYRREAHGA